MAMARRGPHFDRALGLPGVLHALQAAIFIDSIDEVTEDAIRALDDPDPWRGFTGFAESFVQLRASSCGLHDALSGAGQHLDLGRSATTSTGGTSPSSLPPRYQATTPSDSQPGTTNGAAAFTSSLTASAPGGRPRPTRSWPGYASAGGGW